ncbi:MAG: pyrroloquinoline quinone-dependent dehydrogenase [Gemmatimonadetes bacterium]|nr:pyrroloquinoline quinone-dependent dehydrogenase [Gemmatimonadota bacterium]
MSRRLRRMPIVTVLTSITILACGEARDGSGGSAALAGNLDAGDWPHYAGDAGAMGYSPLTEIDRGNVSGLEVAWTWNTDEEPLAGPRLPVPGASVRPGAFEVTPVVVNDTMYLSTPYNRVVALDASSGREIWAYDPETIEWGQPPNGTGFVHRGIAMWSGTEGRRIFLNSRWRLIALDAATGETIEDFGHGGEIDLTEHLQWPTNRLHYTQTSPPVIYGDLVILGNGLWDGFSYDRDPPGHILAFDVHTGELRWRFNLIPQEGEFGNDSWEDDSWDHVGHTNAWAPLSVDTERGLVFAPIGTPSNNYYGGGRKGDNLFAESLVVLDATSGERVWHFQAVHHGLWDWDLPSQPTLFPLTVEGRSIDAVAISTKMGFLFVFDRETGEPVWPIEERPVPQSDVPGERTSPTQPFPTMPPPFARQGFSEEDLTDFTPELHAEARAFIRSYRMGPIFAPPSMEGTIISPGIIGGGNWGGTAVDPETGYLYVKSSNQPALLAIGPADPDRTEGTYDVDRSRRRLRLPNGLPIYRPPYGTLTAYDLTVGEIAWQRPIGDTPAIRQNPALDGVDLPDRLGVSGAPGPIVTAGGLVFLTGGGNVLYAIDSQSGEELWAGDLGQVGYANPMTYRTREGRQYVVIATGRGQGTRLMAFALSGAGLEENR